MSNRLAGKFVEASFLEEVANDPKITAEEQEELVTNWSRCRNALVALANNKGISPRTAWGLFHEVPFEAVLLALAENPATPLPLVLRLEDSGLTPVKVALAKRLDASEEQLLRMVRSRDLDLVKAVAGRHNKPHAVIKELMESDDVEAQIALANSLDLDADIEKALALHDSDLVRAAIAARHTCRAERYLALDGSPRVIEALLNNRSVTASVSQQCLKHCVDTSHLVEIDQFLSKLRKEHGHNSVIAIHLGLIGIYANSSASGVRLGLQRTPKWVIDVEWLHGNVDAKPEFAVLGTLRKSENNHFRNVHLDPLSTFQPILDSATGEELEKGREIQRLIHSIGVVAKDLHLNMGWF
jgi:hypothetical protein